MNAHPPSIQSVGPPPDKHAERVVSEMLAYLQGQQRRLWDNATGSLKRSQLGNPVGQHRAVTRFALAAGSLALDIKLQTGKRGRFKLTFISWMLWDPANDCLVASNEPPPATAWVAICYAGGGGAGGTAGTVAGGGAGGGGRKEVKPLKGGTLYAQARNLFSALPYPFTYDEMHDRCYYNGDVLSDALIGQLREYFINVSDEHKDPTLKRVWEVTEAMCFVNRFDPEKDWLDGLVWDGVPRIDRLLTFYCGVEDTPLARAVGRKLMIAKAQRSLYPGCMHDWALVLEGPQGCGKTSFARILAGTPDRIIDSEIIKLDKTQVQQEALLGRTVHEIAEMSDIRKADVNMIKAYMSRTHDRARGAYGHSLKDQPRRCVYIGTTNDAQYLPDETNRRFYPFKVGVIKLIELLRDRMQLHAEAVAMVRKGEDAVVPKSLWAVAAIEQRKRRIEDPWEDVVGEALRGEIERNANGVTTPIVRVVGRNFGSGAVPTIAIQVVEIDHKSRKVWFISSTAVLTGILDIPLMQQHGMAGRRARAIMGRLGWERTQIKVVNHVTRGFIYDLASRGIGAGEWSKYKDGLDEESEAEEAAAKTAELPTEGNSSDPQGGEEQAFDIDDVVYDEEVEEDGIIIDGDAEELK